jgi:hypothetical protein
MRDALKGVARTVAVSALFLGCGPSGPPGPAPAGSPEPPDADSALMVPPGHGTLLQDQISLRLQRGNLLIKVTPLEEWVIRLTAPDTYLRLRGLVDAFGPQAERAARTTALSLFLVSLFSYQPDVTYEPEELQLVNRGLRFRSLGIVAVTPAWGTQRLAQQETRMAIYAFEGGLDLESELVVQYQDLRNDRWREGVLPLLEAERARVRARGKG